MRGKRYKVAVVGAGVGGLAAAWNCKQLGYDVTVFASVDGIGAPCQSYRTHGFLWEAGSPHLASPNVAVWLLLKSLHLRQQVVFSRKRRPKFLRSNRTNPGLATLARLRPAHVHAWIQGRGWQPAAAIFGSFLSFGKRFKQNAYCYQASTAAAAAADADAGAGAIRTPFANVRCSGTRLVSFSGGMQTLATALQDKLGDDNLRKLSKVESIAKVGTEENFFWKVCSRGRTDALPKHVATVDAVVFADDLDGFRNEVKLSEFGARCPTGWIPRVRQDQEYYAAMTSALVLGFSHLSPSEKRTFRGAREVFTSPRDEDRLIRSVVHDSAMFTGRCTHPQSEALMTVFLKTAKLKFLSRKDMVGAVLAELDDIVPGVARLEPQVCQFVLRCDGALPTRADTDAHDHAAAARELERVPGLFWLNPSGSSSPGGAILDAAVAAHKVDHYFAAKRSQHWKLLNSEQKVVTVDAILQNIRRQTKERQTRQERWMKWSNGEDLPRWLANHHKHQHGPGTGTGVTHASQSALRSASRNAAEADVQKEIDREKAVFRSERSTTRAEIRTERHRKAAARGRKPQ